MHVPMYDMSDRGTCDSKLEPRSKTLKSPVGKGMLYTEASYCRFRISESLLFCEHDAVYRVSAGGKQATYWQDHHHHSLKAIIYAIKIICRQYPVKK